MEFTLKRPGEPGSAALRIGIVVLALFLLVALAAMVGLATAYDGRILPGVRVAGVPVGGLAPDDARARLTSQADAIGSVRADLTAEDVSWHPTMAELGLGLEPGQATQDAYAVGRLGGPLGRALVVARAPFESIDVTPAAASRPAIAAWVERAARDVDRPARDAWLEITPAGEVRQTAEQGGRQLDRAAATDQIEGALDDWLAALPRDGQRPLSLALATRTVAPAVVAADLAPARQEAERVLGRPTSLRVDELQQTLDRPALAALLTLRHEGKVTLLDVDQGRLATLIRDLAGRTDRAPVDARLAIGKDGKIDAASDTPGRRLNQATAAEQLRAAVLGSGPVDLALPAEQIPAAVRAADLAAARTSAERLLAGPTAVAAGDKTFTYQPAEIAPLLTIQGGALAVDRKQVEAGVAEIVKQTERAPHNARLKLVGDSLQPIDEGIDGQRVDPGKAADAIVAGLAKGERRIAVPVDVTPAIKSADRAAFGPLEVIEQSSTSYAGSIPERAHNVELAASRLNGTVVAPGQMFSFNETLGPQTIANGFQWAWGIAGGAGGATTVPSVGGGICQVATTLFHSVFWSGYQIEERNWHLYWIPRYGAPPLGLQGLDATVDYDSNTDLKWLNNSDSPVLIQSWTDGANVYFALRGKKPSWTVDVTKPQISGIVPALGGTWTETTPSMPRGASLWVEEARAGFSSRIVRTVTAPGAEPRVLSLTSTYQPSRNIVMVGTG